MKEGFNPEVHLEDIERAELSVVVAHPGFKVIKKIFRSCVDVFAIDLLNTPTSADDEILSKHRDARVAAQLYTLLANRINTESQAYVASKISLEPVNVTEDLDIDDNYNEDEAEETLF